VNGPQEVILENEQGTRRQLEAALVTKCWKDPDFRQKVVSDPKGMLEQHIGQKLPPQMKIFIHEEDTDTVHFSIPPAPADLTELSDAELESVAGGTDVFTTLAVVLTAALTVAGTIASVRVTVEDQGW
jgi:nitrile hydratase alpha subunit